MWTCCQDWESTNFSKPRGWFDRDTFGVSVWPECSKNTGWWILLKRSNGFQTPCWTQGLQICAFHIIWGQVFVKITLMLASTLVTKLYLYYRGILSNFILDPSLQSALPVFCLCDAADGEKTSVLGIEKGKNKDLTHHKITVAGPVSVSNPATQFDQLKSEMAFLTNNGEVTAHWRCSLKKILTALSNFLLYLQFSAKAFAVYEAYRGIHLPTEPEEDEAFVRLECCWKNPTKILELPHIASQAKVVALALSSLLRLSFLGNTTALVIHCLLLDRSFVLYLERRAVELMRFGANWIRFNTSSKALIRWK